MMIIIIIITLFLFFLDCSILKSALASSTNVAWMAELALSTGRFHGRRICSKWKTKKRLSRNAPPVRLKPSTLWDCSRNHNVALLQPGRRLSEHNHGGGLPDDRHTLQMGRVPVCRQGRPLVCRPQLRLPATAAGVSGHTTVGGKRPRTHSPKACDIHTTVRTLFWFLDGSCSVLVISWKRPLLCGAKQSPWY